MFSCAIQTFHRIPEKSPTISDKNLEISRQRVKIPEIVPTRADFFLEF